MAERRYADEACASELRDAVFVTHSVYRVCFSTDGNAGLAGAKRSSAGGHKKWGAISGSP